MNQWRSIVAYWRSVPGIGKFAVIVLSFSAFVVVLSAFGPKDPDYNRHFENRMHPDQHIAVGMSKNEVLYELGRPDDSQTVETLQGRGDRWRYRGWQLDFANGSLVQFGG